MSAAPSRGSYLHRHLGGHGAVDDTGHFVTGQDIERILFKVCHINKPVLTNALESLQRNLSLVSEATNANIE